MKPGITAIIPRMGTANVDKLVKELEGQTTPPARIIIAEGGQTLTEDYNSGIMQVDTEYTLLLQSDCLPFGKRELEKLLAACSKDGVVAATSYVVLTGRQWDSYSFWGKALMAKFVGVVDQGISGKLDLVRTEALQSIGGYDSQHFLYSGDDVDLYLRLRKRGAIVNADTYVIHDHDSTKVTFMDVLRKRYHWGQSTGALFRVHGLGVTKARYAKNTRHHTNKFITLSLPLLYFLPSLWWLYVLLLFILEPAFLQMTFSKAWLKLIPGIPVIYAADLLGYLSGLTLGRQACSVYR